MPGGLQPCSACDRAHRIARREQDPVDQSAEARTEGERRRLRLQQPVGHLQQHQVRRRLQGKVHQAGGHRLQLRQGHARGAGQAEVGEIGDAHRAGILHHPEVAAGAGTGHLGGGDAPSRAGEAEREPREGGGLAGIHAGTEHRDHGHRRSGRDLHPRQGEVGQVEYPPFLGREQAERLQPGRGGHLAMARALDGGDATRCDQGAGPQVVGHHAVELIRRIAVAIGHQYQVPGEQMGTASVRTLDPLVLADASHPGQQQIPRMWSDTLGRQCAGAGEIDPAGDEGRLGACHQIRIQGLTMNTSAAVERGDVHRGTRVRSGLRETIGGKISHVKAAKRDSVHGIACRVRRFGRDSPRPRYRRWRRRSP